jgi:hypothetical protein
MLICHVTLIHISMMTGGFEHFFVCLLAIWISFFCEVLFFFQIVYLFLLDCLSFYYWVVMHSSCVKNISLLVNMCFATIFSRATLCLFILLMFYLINRKFWLFLLWFFFSMVSALMLRVVVHLELPFVNGMKEI